MDFYLQFGYGMMAHSEALIRAWGGGTVILSPRDLDNEQLQSFSRRVCRAGGSVLLDPQFYLPNSDHHRLSSHEFWPGDYASGLFWTGRDLIAFLDRLRDLNGRLTCSRFILPGRLATEVDDLWLNAQRAIMSGAAAMGVASHQLTATVALGEAVMDSREQLHTVIEESRNWGVSEIYLVCEHPRGDYLVESPAWVAGVLDLVAGFRLNGLRVVVGYSNQQSLINACAAANAIASGTWMNVRSFSVDKFQEQEEEETRRKAVWYYCPQALSEFKRPTLDTALRLGVLSRLAPPQQMQNPAAAKLFRGVNPTASGFGEQDMFRHYLHSLRVQAITARRATFEETVRAHEASLDEAEALLEDLHRLRIREKGREFSDAVNANRQALTLLEQTHGPMLRRRWATL